MLLVFPIRLRIVAGQAALCIRPLHHSLGLGSVSASLFLYMNSAVRKYAYSTARNPRSVMDW